MITGKNGKILDIIAEPNSKLRQKSETVKEVNEEIRTLLNDMLATMYSTTGIGLAAVQVGILKRVAVIDIDKNILTKKYGKDYDLSKIVIDDETKSKLLHGGTPLFLINPEIISSSSTLSDYEEGCLSVPTAFAEVKRPNKIKIRYLDQYGKQCELESEGNLLTICIQHEIDHTNGILFVDRLSRLKKDFVLKKYHKHTNMHKTEE